MSAYMLKKLLPEGWEIRALHRIEGREPETFPVHDLPLSPETQAFLSQRYPQGIFRHQREALQSLSRGKNVCLTTGTGSGKSLVFYAWAIERLAQNPQARILALYPLKALNQDQHRRWEAALDLAGLHNAVGVIDGSVAKGLRTSRLERKKVIIMTPDVLHAWFLRNLYEGNFMDLLVEFLRNLEVVILDEAHVYSGVFGTHAAYLFRRLRHAQALVGKQAQWIVSSATLEDPLRHLRTLTGLDYVWIGESQDTSPRYPLHLAIVSPPSTDLSDLGNFLVHLYQNTNERFIFFADSRKFVETLATVTVRAMQNAGISVTTDQDPFAMLQRLDILPYRSGYEADDRKLIHKRLQEGSLRGVIATSALELGIDIPHLTTGILHGIPYSATSFQQRMGRIGRAGPGQVFVILPGATEEKAHQCLDELLHLSPSPGVFYLENPFVQYLHALCLSDPELKEGGEHKRLCKYLGIEPEPFQSDVEWPESFLSIMNGQPLPQIVEMHVREMVRHANSVHHAFPLRSIDTQYEIFVQTGTQQERLGTIDASQIVREAYPGAVYYHIATPYRVREINPRTLKILVKREKQYFTDPRMYTATFPNFAEPYQAKIFRNLVVIEASTQVKHVITGFEEKRGNRSFVFEYPLDPSDSSNEFRAPTRYRRDRWEYFFPTTGVFLHHPSLNALSGRGARYLQQILLHALLRVVPYEQREIGSATGLFRYVDEALPIEKEGRFLVIYDQAYGGLRLSSRLIEKEILQKVLETARRIRMEDQHCFGPVIVLKETDQEKEEIGRISEEEEDNVILNVLDAMIQDLEGVDPRIITKGLEVLVQDAPEDEERVRVLCPGSIGFVKGREPFVVQRVFFHPKLGLCYGGYYTDTPRASATVPVHHVIFTEDQKTGIYNLSTGELECANGSAESGEQSKS